MSAFLSLHVSTAVIFLFLTFSSSALYLAITGAGYEWVFVRHRERCVS